MPAAMLKSSPARCVGLPALADAKLTCCGLALTQATYSLTVLAGIDGWITSRYGPPATRLTGAKSRSVSYGRLLCTDGLMACPAPMMSSVCPSGFARATMAEPIVLFPPGSVVDHDLLPEPLGQPVGDDPRHRIVRAPGRKRHDEPYGTRRISLRGTGRRQRRNHGGREQSLQLHVPFDSTPSG